MEEPNQLSSEDKFNEYIEKRKLDVPLYDPQTGEPNLNYEKLTGKKNPILQLRKMPLQYEPKRKNRFIITFPKNFGIESWVVSDTSRPSVTIKNKKFLGITYKKVIEWERIYMKLVDPIGPSSADGVMKIIEESTLFNYILEMLDPTGMSVEKWYLKDCTLESVDFGTLSYKSDGLATINLVIVPKKVELVKIK